MILPFFNRAMFRDDELALVPSREDVRSIHLGIREGYTFNIFLRKTRRCVGYVSLRIGESPALYYLGHIGYRIEPDYRGHGYAARACQMITPLMQELNLRSVCITADPDNTPSRKTCERIGCELESIVRVPAEFLDVCAGSQHKCRYILTIPEVDEGGLSCR